MKKYLVILTIIMIFGCSVNPRYAGGDKKRVVHRKYVTKTMKQKAKESVANAPKLDIKVGDKFYFVSSYYGKKFHGKPCANGEIFDMYKYTAAHKSLPFNTKLKVTNEDNGKSVVVRVIDRGPFVDGRDLDLSYAAAKKIGLISYGVKKLKVEIIKIGN